MTVLFLKKKNSKFLFVYFVNSQTSLSVSLNRENFTNFEKIIFYAKPDLKQNKPQFEVLSNED